jgi:uncharacterized caspase-like protein
MTMAFRKLLRACAALALAALILGSTGARAEKRVALVVGVARYANVPPLRSPVNDASAVAAELRSAGFSTVLLTDPDQKTFRRALASFGREAEGADVGLIYYAGHAAQVEDRNYALPVDANPESEDDLSHDSVPFKRIRDSLEQARLRIVIFDACRNNPFAARFPSQSRGLQRGLAAELPEAATLLAFSTSPGQTADDGDADHSPYAAALLKHMLTPGLELGVVLIRVSGDVRQATNNRQAPVVEDDRGKEFYLMPAPAATPGAQLAGSPPASPDRVAAREPSVAGEDSKANGIVEPDGERQLIVKDVVVVDQPGIARNEIGRLRAGDIVVVVPFKSERWRAIQMDDGKQGFVDISATRRLQ